MATDVSRRIPPLSGGLFTAATGAVVGVLVLRGLPDREFAVAALVYGQLLGYAPLLLLGLARHVRWLRGWWAIGLFFLPLIATVAIMIGGIVVGEGKLAPAPRVFLGGFLMQFCLGLSLVVLSAEDSRGPQSDPVRP